MPGRSPKSSELDRVEVERVSELTDWLERHHQQADSVWLVTWKKASPERYVPRRAILESLLAYGWIDSLPRKLDSDRTMLLISPRQPGSSWSKVNRDIVADLLARGAMKPAGLLAMQRAVEDGSWVRLESVDRLVVPPDLGAALEANPVAAHYFARFPPSSRRGILEWIDAARRPETRAQRVVETVTKAAENRKANFPPGRDRGPSE